MSPRRSSRARSSANPPPAPSQTGSSNSSTNLKNTHTPQRSESIEDTATLDDEASTEPIMPRRSRRNGVDDSREPSQNAKPGDDFPNDQEPMEEDPEEVTRCICGRLDYPGPTTAIPIIEQYGTNPEVFTKETGDFFVQCDKCLVWQHGGCMGFHDEANLPEEYYCELCKPKLHKIQKTLEGKRSRFTPPKQEQPKPDSSRSSSLSSSDARKKDKKALAESTKRRATMNSRHTDYEDEMLRRAIEESSKDSGTLGKRAREDGDDLRQALKRQRTGSVSSDSQRSGSLHGTDDGTTRKSKQSLRGAVAKSNKERDAREKAKEQQAALRAEAASKRNARSERRRGEDSPPPSPSTSPSKGLTASLQKGKDKAETPPVTSKSTSKSKNARNNRGGRRVGRNQYTRDRDLNGNIDTDSAMRDDHNGNGTGRNSPGQNIINGESGRSSKAKTHPARTSMNEMKRRVAAILEFVGQMQTQSSRHPQTGKNGDKSGSGSGSEKGTPAAIPGVASLVKAVQAATEDMADVDTENGDLDLKGKLKMRDDAEFKDMGSIDMMEALTRELIDWQRVYGVYSR